MAGVPDRQEEGASRMEVRASERAVRRVERAEEGEVFSRTMVAASV
jgi:hypothetical protein